MPVVCLFSNLSSATACARGGIKAVKIIPRNGINFATINAAFATYMTAATYDLTATPPAKNAGAVWSTLNYDASLNPVRKAVMPANKFYADIEIGALRFNGKMSTKVLLGFRECCHWVVATLYNDGTIYIDGLDLDDSVDRFFVAPRFQGLTMGEYTHSSENGDDENIHNNTFVIAGKSPHVGYIYTGTWASLV